MYFTVLSLVLAVLVASAAASAGCYCWRAVRRRHRHPAEWARLAAELKDLDDELDRVRATEQEGSGRHR